MQKNIEKYVEEFKKRGYEASEKEVTKNGVKFQALEVKEINSKSCIAALFYLNEAEQRDIEDIVNSFISNLNFNAINVNKTMDIFKDKDYILENIKLGVQMYGDKTFINESIPGTDFVKYMYINLDVFANNDTIGSVKITQGLLDNLKIDIEHLWETAEKNTEKELIHQTLSDVLREILLTKEPDMDEELLNSIIPETDYEMYVVSNKSKTRGAAAIICENYLNDLCNKLEIDKLIILPSSIHEIIVIPVTDHMPHDNDELRKMVQEVNSTQVPAEEILSNNAYIYTASELKLL